MPTSDTTALELVHRLLFRALVEMRAQGHENKNKLVFHLADLFHNAVLDMEAAAEGRLPYDEVFRRLEEKAREKNCERWFQSALGQIGAGRAARFEPPLICTPEELRPEEPNHD